MSWDVSPPARRRGRYLPAGAAAVLLVGTAVLIGLHRGGARTGPAAGPASASPAAAVSLTAAPLRLPAPHAPAGSEVVPLGFPHTAAGAASAGWRWTQVMYGLDPARAAAAAAACADPTFPAAAARAAATTLAVRASLGVAASGPASPAYLVVTPRMVLLTGVDPDFPVVDVLATADLGSAAGARLHRVQVLELHLHWAPSAGGGGDYRLLDRDGDPLRVAGLTADPDTPAAYRLGWRDATPQEATR